MLVLDASGKVPRELAALCEAPAAGRRAIKVLTAKSVERGQAVVALHDSLDVVVAKLGRAEDRSDSGACARHRCHARPRKR